MKILEVSAVGYIDGGIETGLVLSKSLLEKRGHEVRILASDLRPDLPHFDQYSYKRPTSLVGKFAYSFNPYAYRELKRVLEEFRPDVVNIHSVDHASPSIFFALRKWPTVLMVHGPEPFVDGLVLWCFPESNFRHGRREVSDLTFVGWLRYIYHLCINRPLYRLGLRRVDKIVTLSHYMHDLLEREGLHNEYVPNGTILFPHSPLRPEEMANTLAFVGRLESYKGVDYLLEAMPTIRAKFPDVRLLLAGGGEERANLEALTQRLGLGDTVAFLGRLDRAELEKLYQRAAMVVVPSTYPEAFGKIGVEAMSVGRPVVATDVGGIHEWLHDGKNGLLVPPANAPALAEAIVKLLADRELYARMAARARETVEQFDLENHVTLMEKIYSRVIRLKKQ